MKITKNILFVLILSFVVIVAILVVSIGKTDTEEILKTPDYELAAFAAKELYRKRAIEGWDFSDGACLTNDLKPGWVVDIVHSPRQSVDDLSENQCGAYLEGRANHFVELDTKGNFVRAR